MINFEEKCVAKMFIPIKRNLKRPFTFLFSHIDKNTSYHDIRLKLNWPIYHIVVV